MIISERGLSRVEEGRPHGATSTIACASSGIQNARLIERANAHQAAVRQIAARDLAPISLVEATGCKRRRSGSAQQPEIFLCSAALTRTLDLFSPIYS
jgi:hypothetical protein